MRAALLRLRHRALERPWIQPVVGSVTTAAVVLSAWVLVSLSGGTSNPLVPLASLGIVVAAWAAGAVLGGRWHGARPATESERNRDAIRRIVDRALAAPTSAAACHHLLAELAQLRPMLASSIFVVDDAETYLLASWNGTSGPLQHRRHLGDVGVRLLRELAGGDRPRRRPYAVTMLPDDSGEELRRRGARSDVIVPLVTADGLLGALLIAESSEPVPLQPEEARELAEVGQSVAALVQRALRHEQAEERRVHERIMAIVDAPQLLEPVFQPIVSLPNQAVAGYEALARFATGEPPTHVFEQASRAGLGAQLEALAIRRAREVADDGHLPAGTFLAINIGPRFLGHPAIVASLGGDLRQVVLELTENEAVSDYEPVRRALAQYRSRGARVAVDDAGAGYASMRHVTELRPDFVKLDARLIRGLRGSLALQAFLRAMHAFVSEIGATLVAEGVEDPEDLLLLEDADLPLLVQGYAIALPGRSWPAIVMARRVEAVDAVAQVPISAGSAGHPPQPMPRPR